ncbi:hypothetical protein, partial [uncultured Nostoc sp.]
NPYSLELNYRFQDRRGLNSINFSTKASVRLALVEELEILQHVTPVQYILHATVLAFLLLLHLVVSFDLSSR